MFKGSLVALVTPFKNGEVDTNTLRKLVKWHIDQGTDGIVPCGTTGESATLSHEEHHLVISTVVEAAAGKVKVLAGTGSNNTAEAVELTQHAEKAGADGALLICPYYNKPSQEGLYRHFKAIAASVRFPLVPYNIPGRTSVNMLPQTLARLAEDFPNIWGVKEATGDLNQVSRTLEESKGRIQVLSGDDALTLPIMAIGGVGVISVIANLLPKETARLTHLCAQGKWEQAREQHYRLQPLIRSMFLETNPGPVKTAMGMMGLIDPELRLPMVAISGANQEALKKVLETYNLIGETCRKN
ncbi:MAG: 4-hydroxy-tetrahydrodipicolinate synthase [Candidatus Omnitrophica bacterium]|nr:4-hydroxy-tetrahydrodipicolinate synthase [Candidatus Omnitrophota bacterium]